VGFQLGLDFFDLEKGASSRELKISPARLQVFHNSVDIERIQVNKFSISRDASKLVSYSAGPSYVSVWDLDSGKFLGGFREETSFSIKPK
jgi:hypothetical protein